MDRAIKNNFLINKYTNTTMEPIINNYFKILIPNVNLLLNSGKKILFLLYELAGIIFLKLCGMIFYLWLKWFQEN
jgi:hypothetical protein